MDNSQAKRETFPKRDFYSEASFRAYDRSLIVVMLQCMQNSEGNNARQRKSTFFFGGGGDCKDYEITASLQFINTKIYHQRLVL
jgi:hypothetical protein